MLKSLVVKGKVIWFLSLVKVVKRLGVFRVLSSRVGLKMVVERM